MRHGLTHALSLVTLRATIIVFNNKSVPLSFDSRQVWHAVTITVLAIMVTGLFLLFDERNQTATVWGSQTLPDILKRQKEREGRYSRGNSGSKIEAPRVKMEPGKEPARDIY